MKILILEVCFPSASRDNYIRILHQEVGSSDRAEIVAKRNQLGLTTTPEVSRKMPRLMPA